MSIAMFQKKNLTEVAASLDVHPFDIARMYGQEAQGLPKELCFSAEERMDIAQKLGLEFWWTEQKSFTKKEAVTVLMTKLWERKLVEPTRGDNLYRGLEGEVFQLLRSVVNTMIRIEILKSAPGPFGIVVSKGKNFDTMLGKIVTEGEYPPELKELYS